MVTNINHDYYPDEYLKEILTQVKSIALVGASPRKERASYLTMKALIEQGYIVYPVNPLEAGNLIQGQLCYADLGSIGFPVDMVDIFRSSEAALAVTRDAVCIGAKVVWMQLMIVNHQAADIAQAAGLKVVMNRCPKIELEKPYWTEAGYR